MAREAENVPSWGFIRPDGTFVWGEGAEDPDGNYIDEHDTLAYWEARDRRLRLPRGVHSSDGSAVWRRRLMQLGYIRLVADCMGVEFYDYEKLTRDAREALEFWALMVGCDELLHEQIAPAPKGRSWTVTYTRPERGSFGRIWR